MEGPHRLLRTLRAARISPDELKARLDRGDTTIILDYCKRCLGFWMDGKELVRINEEVKRLNEADAEVPDPLLVRISQFFWNLPLPH